MKYQGKKIKSLVSVSSAENTAQMQLFGVIGKDIDGNRFAQDIVQVSQFGFSEVQININSVGGSIFEGFSIINAMNILRMTGTGVATRGIGVVDSMAGIILAFGDRGKRTAADITTGVIHEPMFEDKDGNLIKIDELPDGKLKTEATFMRTSLLTSLEGSTGASKKELKQIMSEGTRRSAKELKAIGIIDSVFETTNKVDVQNLSDVQLMKACAKIVISQNNSLNKNPKVMSIVNKKLGLNPEASETAQAEAIQKITDRATTAEDKVAGFKNKETELQKLKDENKVLQTNADTANKLLVETFVDQQVEAGKFKKEDTEKLVNQATADFAGFKVICESLNGTFVDVTKSLGTGAGDKTKVDELVNKAKAYHEADVDGTLEAYKNEVGAEKFKVIEEFYTNNLDKVLED